MGVYYVECFYNFIAQHPIVVRNGEIIAQRFKGMMYEDAEARAERLAAILNARLKRRNSTKDSYGELAERPAPGAESEVCYWRESGFNDSVNKYWGTQCGHVQAFGYVPLREFCPNCGKKIKYVGNARPELAIPIIKAYTKPPEQMF